VAGGIDAGQLSCILQELGGSVAAFKAAAATDRGEDARLAEVDIYKWWTGRSALLRLVTMWTAVSRPRTRALAAPVLLLLLPLRGGKPALRTSARTTPRREGRRVGVGGSERT
jgi:hypothetical protein